MKWEAGTRHPQETNNRTDREAAARLSNAKTSQTTKIIANPFALYFQVQERLRVEPIPENAFKWITRIFKIKSEELKLKCGLVCEVEPQVPEILLMFAGWILRNSIYPGYDVHFPPTDGDNRRHLTANQL